MFPTCSGQGYGNAACEAACDVVRSCVLSPECRTVLAQSGFFADAVAQIRYGGQELYYNSSRNSE